MDDRDAGPTGQQTLNLIRILTALNEIETSINRLGMGYDLTLTLRLIVDNAVRAVAATSDCDGPLPNASAIIWVYDEVRQEFRPGSRRVRQLMIFPGQMVWAGEPFVPAAVFCLMRKASKFTRPNRRPAPARWCATRS